ncbi:hypothetical protein TWF788_003903 [Orbilia oligospora]|uniref:Uncharacterized protein n=1 Tax=Orbilia oligospora TaxID=2813651 RepID=A0A7C8U0U5_ORBOL|nr:hypothetical protein TWF788_003903 [Orbilia oligospora]
MEPGPALELCLKDDWSKPLYSAPRLIQIMGICAALTTKKEVITMQLQDSRLPNKGLLSNLLHLSNHGQSAFQQAHSDSYKIAIRAEDIARDGGYIDRIISNFGRNDPRARKRLERALRGLQEQVTQSKGEGSMTLAEFSEWKRKTDILQEAVANEKGAAEGARDGHLEEKKKIEESCKIASEEKTEAKNRLDSTATAAENSKKAAANAWETFGFAGGLALSGFAMPMTMGMLGVTIGATIASMASYNQFKTAEEAAKRNLESQSRLLQGLEEQLSALEKIKTVNDLICETVNFALQNLTSLQQNICDLVTDFKMLSTVIGTLAEKCNQEFHKFVLETECDAEGEVDTEDLGELLDYARQIKTFALIVHTKARVYATVSQSEISRGFQVISAMSNCNPSISDNEHIERTQGELSLYKSSAELGISRSIHEYCSTTSTSTIIGIFILRSGNPPIRYLHFHNRCGMFGKLGYARRGIRRALKKQYNKGKGHQKGTETRDMNSKGQSAYLAPRGEVRQWETICTPFREHPTKQSKYGQTSVVGIHH